MKFRWVIGTGSYLDTAAAAWKRLCRDEDVVSIEVRQHADFEFDLSVLDGLNPADGMMFVAIDDRFGNFKRTELMQIVLERGFKLQACVSATAIVADDLAIGPNAFVGDGVVIGAHSRVDYNAVLHPGVKIGAGVHIHSSCWLEIGVTIGSGAEIGAHSIVRMGATIAPNVKVGRGCELGWPQLYKNDVPDKTTFDARFDEPICVYGH